MHSDYILKTTDLTKKYKNKIAVENINMTIKKGDIYGLIGKNGAGKTTLMKLILSLTYPTNGEVELFGSKNFIDSRGRVGSLIETPGYYKGCTARENMLRFASLYGVPKDEALELLTKVGLQDAIDRKVGKFSLGMKQKLGIAIALLGNPEFVILDEPVNGLDPEGMVDVRKTIQKLNKEDGITFLISSHLLSELSKAATRYGIIKDGRLIEEFSTDEIVGDTYKIIISTPNNSMASAAAVAIHQKMPDLYIQRCDNEIIIISDTDICGELNTLLVKDNALIVNRLNIEFKTVEQYFLEKVGAVNE